MRFLLLPFALLAYYVIVLLFVGRRPKAGVIVPQYTPPGDMTPAEMRFLRAGMTDQKSVAAVVAHLAARGQISVQPDGAEYVITRLIDEPPAGLPDEERAAFVSMFLVSADVTDPSSTIGVYRTRDDMPLGRSFRLRPNQGNKLAAIRVAISGSLDRRMGSSYFKRNYEYSAAAIALSSALAIGAATTFRHAEGILFLALWFVFGATILGVSMVVNLLPVLRDILRGRMMPSNTLLFAGPLLIFLAALAYVGHRIAVVSDPAFAISLVAIIMLNASCPFLLQAPTQLGQERRDQVEGFRQFLASVELDSINRLNNPNWTPTLKVDYLAYAIALDLKQAWGDHLVSAMFNTVTAGQ
jgi:hypothetical protein